MHPFTSLLLPSELQSIIYWFRLSARSAKTVSCERCILFLFFLDHQFTLFKFLMRPNVTERRCLNVLVKCGLVSCWQEVGGCGFTADRSRMGRLRRLHGSQSEGGVLPAGGPRCLLHPWPTQGSHGEAEFVCIQAWWRRCNTPGGVNTSLLLFIFKSTDGGKYDLVF